MLVTLRPDADVRAVEAALKGLGQWTTRLRDADGTARGLRVEPHSAPASIEVLRALPGVADVWRAPSPHPRVDAQAGAAVPLPGGAPLLVAGPCSVESPEQALAAAALAAGAGATALRGGAFKPRSSPYAFDGHGRAALGWLRAAADAHGLAVVTEVLGEQHVEAVAAVADVLQVGSRNMQNFALLRALGAAGKPVLLKRGMAATVEEWLLAGEHLLTAGAGTVVFCERGVRGFDPETRNLLDLGAVALLKHAYRQPVLVDPSHAAGRRDLVVPLAAAALAAGADGVIVEVHPDPGAARSDGPQALDAAALVALTATLEAHR